MKADENKPEAAELERWVRAVCGEALAAAGLQAGLTTDPMAAAEFQETRNLVSDLRAALQPEPLPQSLVTAITRRVRAPRDPSLRVLRLIAPLCAAAAAALAAAVIWQYGSAPPAESTAIVLSSQDAADIVAADVLLSWEGQVQTSVNEIASEIGGLQKATERISQAGTNLPWSADDDWDAATTEGQSRAGFYRRA